MTFISTSSMMVISVMFFAAFGVFLTISLYFVVVITAETSKRQLAFEKRQDSELTHSKSSETLSEEDADKGGAK